MSDFIDDAMVEAACNAVGVSKREWMRLALEAALPMIGEKLTRDMENFFGVNDASAARIRELTGARQAMTADHAENLAEARDQLDAQNAKTRCPGSPSSGRGGTGER